MRQPSALFFALVTSAAAANAAAADLMSVYRDAQSADPVYASARAAYQAGQEKLPQGLAGLLPAVSASANSLYNDRTLAFRGPTTGSGGTTRFNSNSVSVVATQPLFSYQNWITYEQAKVQVSQAEAQFLQPIKYSAPLANLVIQT